MIGHHRFKLVLSFAQVWLVRESVYGLYAPTLSNREMWQEEVCYSRACARCLVDTARCRVDSATGHRFSRRSALISEASSFPTGSALAG